MYEKLVLVVRKTRLGELVERFNTKAQAKFYIEHSGGDFKDYEGEDDRYRRALETLRKDLDLGLGLKVQVLDRGLLPTSTFVEQDLIVTLGQDGLVANTAKYVGSQPVVAVNPDPARFDGVLLPFKPEQARAAVISVLQKKASFKEVTLAKAKLNDGQELLAFNDFFIGAKTHVSARYKMTAQGRSERQSSSGIIVSTGAGSTGWLSSVFNMAAGVSAYAGGKPGQGKPWAWSERRLVFVVREPFLSKHSQASIVAGELRDAQTMTVESQMPMNGVIFSDGVEFDALEFNAGAVASIGVAQRQARLVAP